MQVEALGSSASAHHFFRCYCECWFIFAHPISCILELALSCSSVSISMVGSSYKPYDQLTTFLSRFNIICGWDELFVSCCLPCHFSYNCFYYDYGLMTFMCITIKWLQHLKYVVLFDGYTLWICFILKLTVCIHLCRPLSKLVTKQERRLNLLHNLYYLLLRHSHQILVHFFSGAAVQVMAHPGSPFVIPEGNSSRAGNYSFNANVLPKQTDQSQQTVCFSLKSFSFLVYCHAGY